jgi:hypothetical protein
MLKALPKNTLTDMVKMFNFARTNEICSKIWHHAIIAPSYKKGDCLNPKRFHPIVLRSAIAKIYEITLLTRIRHVIEWGWNPPPIDKPNKWQDFERVSLMTRFQIAYRPLQSALDHLSTLHALIVDAEQKMNHYMYVSLITKSFMTNALDHICGQPLLK